MEGDARWIDRLSGPGPFWAFGVNLVVACAVEAESQPQEKPPSVVARYERRSMNECSKRTRSEIRGTIEMRGRYLRTLSGPRFTDARADEPADERGINGLMLELIAKARLHPAMDVGAGFGYIGLWGEGFKSVHRFTGIPLSAKVRPFAFRVRPDYRGALGFWQEAFNVKYEITAIFPPGYTAERFGSAESNYSAKVDYVPSVGFGFEVRF
jgi:hypothetical protein